MYSRAVRSLMILTAMIPIALVYAWVMYADNKIIASIYLLSFSSIMIVVCWMILEHAHRFMETSPFEYNSVEPADQENLSFILLYLSPLFVDQVSNINFNVLLPTIVVYGILLATSYTLQYNPMLALLGWHFYKVSSKEGVTYILLTRKQIRNIDRIEKVGQLAGYMLIDLSE